MPLPMDQLGAFLDAAPDAMVIADLEGSIVFVNSAAETLFGYPRDMLVNQPVEILIPERFRESHAGYRRAFSMAPRRRPMGNGVTLHALRRDGTEFPVDISLSPSHTVSGTFICTAIRDATERTALQARLVETSQQAERANRAKSAFLAAASHDLRQPLQSLALLHGALSRESVPGSATADMLGMQAGSLRVMADLLNSLLDISKLEAGVVRPDIADCSVAAIFERLRAEFAALAEAKGLELIVERNDAMVRSDPSLLAQIIQNLVANAIRYTKKGWVRLRCMVETATVRIEVLDTGIGIPAGELNRIFEEFYQLPRETEQREGLGLGLSIVRRITDLLGHRLAVESTLGSGTRFSISVPRSASSSPGNALSLAGPRQSKRTGASILVVDDDLSVAKATAVLLRCEGYVVALAASTEQACNLLVGQHPGPDAVVCDYHLGARESGIDAIRAFRAVLKREVPAILVTGDTSSEMAKATVEIGNCHLLSKPVNSDALLELIASSCCAPARGIAASGVSIDEVR